MRTKLKKSLSILLALAMLVGLLPTVALATEPATRTKVNSVTATSNINDIIKYDGDVTEPIFTVDDSPAHFDDSRSNWQKKINGTWRDYTDSKFT